MATRKRVNVKVLGIVLGAAAAAAAAGVVGYKMLVKADPRQFIAAGEAAVKDGRWVDAAWDYSKAVKAAPGDTQILIRYGEVVHQAAAFEPDFVSRDRAAYERALEIDPRNVEALDHLLRYWLEYAQLVRSPEGYEQLRATADRLAAIAPDHPDVKYVAIADIQAWRVANLEIAPDRIDAAVDRLTALLDKQRGGGASSRPAGSPAAAPKIDPELPTWIAEVRIKRALDAARAGRAEQAKRNVDQARDLFDTLLAENDQDPALLYRGYGVYRVLANFATTPDDRKAAADKALKALHRARALADVKDAQLHVDIHVASADALAAQGDRAGASALLRDLYTQHPKNPFVRLQFARQLGADPATRQEGIDLLARDAETSLQGLQKLRQKGVESAILIQLANLRIDAYADAQRARDTATADALAKAIDADLAKFGGNEGEQPEFLGAQGYWQLLRGDNVNAIKSLARAKTAFDRRPGTLEWANLNFRLAQAYLNVQQTGEAKKIFQDVAAKFPNHPVAHRALVGLYRQENDVENAKRHYDILKRLLPDDPETARLGLLFIDPEKDKQAVDEQLARMPETSKAERNRKAVIAQQMKRPEEALRLFTDSHTADLTDGDAARTLARYYLLANQKDKAKAVVAESIKAGSTDGQLKVLAAALEKDVIDRDAIDAERLAQINALPDPFNKAIQLAVLAQEQGKRDEVLKQFEAARAIKPEDPTLADLEFQFYCAEAAAAGDPKSPAATAAFAKAEAILPRLAKANRDQAGGDLFLFRLQMLKQDHVAALATARKITQNLPEFAQSWYVYGQVLQTIGQFDDAAKQYQAALDRQGNHPDALRGLIACAYQLGRTQDALRHIQRARTLLPNDPAFQAMEANHHLAYGDPTLALPVREAAAKRSPENPQAQRDLGLAYARAANVKRQGGDAAAAAAFAAKAWDTFAAAKAKWPDDKSFYGLMAELALSGIVDVAKGEAVLKELAERPGVKGTADAHLLLADYYAQTGRFGDAENAFAEAVKVRPDDATYRPYAAYLASRERFTDALAALDKVKDQARPDVVRQRVELLLRAGKVADADAAVTKALAASPDDPSLMNLQAMTAYAAGDLNRALEQVNKVLARRPNDILAVYYRGLVNLKAANGDVQAAIRDLTAVRDATPNNVDARLSLADAFSRVQNGDAAIRELELALRQVPNNKAVRAQLVDWYSRTAPPRWADAEQLLTQAQNDPALKSDPDWPRLESAMWAARKDPAKAIAAAARAAALGNGQPQYLRNYIATLAQAQQHDAVLSETDKIVAANAGQPLPVWVSQFRGVARAAKGDRPGAMTEFETGLRAAFAAKDDDAASAMANTIASTVGADQALKLIADRAATDPRFQLLASMLYQGKGDLNNAIATAEKALANPALTPAERAPLLRVLGGQYLSVTPAKSDQAFETYKKLLDLAPNDIFSLNNISCLLVDQLDRPQEALPYIERAHNLLKAAGQVEPLLLDTYGWTLVRCGRVGEGTTVLLQAVGRKSFPDVHYHLGEAYLLANQPEESIKAFRTASTMLAQSPSPDVVMKVKVESGLRKATELVRGKSEANLPVDTKTP